MINIGVTALHYLRSCGLILLPAMLVVIGEWYSLSPWNYGSSLDVISYKPQDLSRIDLVVGTYFYPFHNGPRVLIRR